MAILFFGGYLLATSSPSVGSLAMRVMPDKLTAAINLNLCQSTVTIDAKLQRPGNPICVKKNVWCAGGTPSVVSTSGSWTNGSPGWTGTAPGYGVAYSGIGVGKTSYCPNLAGSENPLVKFDNGGLKLWFYEPQDSAAIYADNKGSRTFKVTWPAAKPASLLITQPTTGDVASVGQNLVVKWKGTPPEAFSGYNIDYGGEDYNVGLSTSDDINITKDDVGVRPIVVTGYLKGGYVCAMDDGKGGTILSNTMCVAVSSIVVE